MEGEDRILKVDIEKEMRSSYLDYSMSVIVSRALPDARDGLKPVQRRVLYGMRGLGVTPDKQTRKCAAIVGEVLGKYHPHGDSSVYGTLVRLAQDWNLRYPLVYGQGNFGDMDGHGAAAMRYTEAKMMPIAEDVMVDMDKDTVDMVPNFDNMFVEPTVMPTKLPLLLLNGSTGIAVGMATNIAPHNLSEVIDGTCAYIDDRDITIEGLMKYIKAPDFPTGGIIYGYAGVKEGFETGHGRIIIRSKVDIETDENGREKIIVHEVPYTVNKSELVTAIADLVKEKKIDGISNVNDETDKEGLRIVIDIKKEANANVVLNRLYKDTQLQYSFVVNNIALVDGRPQVMTLKDMIVTFVKHRHEVIVRRTKHELIEAEKRAHLLEGLIIAVDNIDEVIQIIKDSKNVQESKNRLKERFTLDDEQATAIVEMRLRQLTGLAIEDLRKDFADLMARIEDMKDILANESRQMQIVKEELLEMKEKYGDERRTQITYVGEEFKVEDMFADDDMIITLSHLGYIKRTPLSDFKAQHRGGIGVKGSASRDEDFIEYIYPASMHQTMLFFTERGKCYWLKVYEVPEGQKNSKGRAIQNLLNIDSEDNVTAFISTKQLQDEEFNAQHNLVFATKYGVIKKTRLSEYSRPRSNGVIAISLNDNDSVIEVKLTSGSSEILIANRKGRAIRFNEQHVRAMGRTATGVKAITLDGPDDEVIGMISVEKDSNENVLVVSDKGFGKRSELEEYRITNRGGKGVKTLNVTEKTGELVAIKSVTDANDMMIINRSGMTIRMHIADIRLQGRATQGVKLINLTRRNDSIASVCIVNHEDEDDVTNDENEEIASSSEQPTE